MSEIRFVRYDEYSYNAILEDDLTTPVVVDVPDTYKGLPVKIFSFSKNVESNRCVKRLHLGENIVLVRSIFDEKRYYDFPLYIESLYVPFTLRKIPGFLIDERSPQLRDIQLAQHHPVYSIIKDSLVNIIEKKLLCFFNDFIEIPDSVYVETIEDSCLAKLATYPYRDYSRRLHRLIQCGNYDAHMKKFAFQDLYVPKNIKKISPKLFFWPIILVTVNKNNPNFKVVKNCLINLTNNLLINYLGSTKTLDLRDENIKEVAPFAFSNSTLLEELYLPNSLKKINKQAIFNCNNLKKIELQNEVDFIDDHAIGMCEKLEEVKLPKVCKYFSNNFVFQGCKSLKNVNYPYSKNLYRIYYFENTRIDPTYYMSKTELLLQDTYYKNLELPNECHVDIIVEANCDNVFVENFNVSDETRSINIDNRIIARHCYVDPKNMVLLTDGDNIYIKRKQLYIYFAKNNERYIVTPKGVHILNNLQICSTKDTKSLIIDKGVNKLKRGCGCDFGYIKEIEFYTNVIIDEYFLDDLGGVETIYMSDSCYALNSFLGDAPFLKVTKIKGGVKIIVI